jgi:hygromycin-B 7''-O-kinase
MHDPEVSPAAIAAIAVRHGVPAAEVRPGPAGVANHVFLLGAELVLRIPRAAEFVADLHKEAAVVPAVRRLGVRTPAVVEFDDGAVLVDRPYLVLERVAGADLARLDLADAARAPVLHEVGRELAALHGGVPATALAEVPADEEASDPRELVAELVAAGCLDADNGHWLRRWFDQLAPYRPAVPQRVLVHGDIAAQNLMVDAGALTGIIDWGDAMWADPAVEFAKLPLAGVVAALDGYRAGAPHLADADDDPFAARVLWYHLAWALARMRHPAPAPGARHWTAPPSSRLVGILRFFAGAVPERWRRLVPRH